MPSLASASGRRHSRHRRRRRRDGGCIPPPPPSPPLVGRVDSWDGSRMGPIPGPIRSEGPKLDPPKPPHPNLGSGWDPNLGSETGLGPKNRPQNGRWRPKSVKIDPQKASGGQFGAWEGLWRPNLASHREKNFKIDTFLALGGQKSTSGGQKPTPNHPPSRRRGGGTTKQYIIRRDFLGRKVSFYAPPPWSNVKRVPGQFFRLFGLISPRFQKKCQNLTPNLGSAREKSRPVFKKVHFLTLPRGHSGGLPQRVLGPGLGPYQDQPQNGQNRQKGGLDERVFGAVFGPLPEAGARPDMMGWTPPSWRLPVLGSAQSALCCHPKIRHLLPSAPSHPKLHLGWLKPRLLSCDCVIVSRLRMRQSCTVRAPEVTITRIL